MSLAAGERKKEMVQIECRWVECSVEHAIIGVDRYVPENLCFTSVTSFFIFSLYWPLHLRSGEWAANKYSVDRNAKPQLNRSTNPLTNQPPGRQCV